MGSEAQTDGELMSIPVVQGRVVRVRLLGRFSVECDDRPIDGPQTGKVSELLSYLLLRRDRAHPRVALADRLWPEGSTAWSRKQLRDTLWRLQSAFRMTLGEARTRSLLEAEPEWVRLNTGSNVWVDVDALECAAQRVRATGSEAGTGAVVLPLPEAISLYRGDLLEGWHQDWCVAERERLRDLYISLLEMALKIGEEQQDFKTVLDYGARILKLDRAHESTHRRLMRARYLLGDRTGAIRQYERCRAALAEELDVAPSRRTEEVLTKIRAENLRAPEDRSSLTDRRAPTFVDSLPNALAHLRKAELLLSRAESRGP